MSFLGPAPASAEAAALAADDLAEVGYVMNVTRLWSHRPEVVAGLFDLLRTLNTPVGLTVRERALLTVAAATAREDAYCALAWAGRLVDVGEDEAALAVLHGDEPDVDERMRAAVSWTRRVVLAPGSTTAADVAILRDAGWDDAGIFAITVHVALRLAFSTVNSALGAVPDPALRADLPEAVRDAVDFGRR